MSLYKYNKYQILLNKDSGKVQGLRVGDIVRRQYYDGSNSIYSLMCVVDCGTDKDGRKYFTGALLDGDAPKTSELLDFARITNLYDSDRDGAIHLSASDEGSPYMDVIANISHDKSLCWPESLGNTANPDSLSQYIVYGKALSAKYNDSKDDYKRVVSITKTNGTTGEFEGLKQDFYQLVENPNRVLIGYYARASKPISLKLSLGYSNGLEMDAEWTEKYGTEWEYKLHTIIVDNSGRHLRAFKIDMSDMSAETDIEIAGLNIILQSTVANFAEATTTRIGKLGGISDPVFGRLNGYGAYLQQLYASNNTHISGTLTAGDENGFGATFYAGKIHRNCFINSTNIQFESGGVIDNEIINPTGIGNVYRLTGNAVIEAQTKEWLNKHIGEVFTFSFWVFVTSECNLIIKQNSKRAGNISVSTNQLNCWTRCNVCFTTQKGGDHQSLYIQIEPAFLGSESNLYITAPQLESGKYATQYQPTDGKLNYTDEYGAWFSRGGIGGTMQNPLIKLNYDGKGSVGTSTKSIELKQDGSGYLANKNISWNEKGEVVFGKDVTLDWANFSHSAQNELVSRYVRIVGKDTIQVIKGETRTLYNPNTITLSVNKVGFENIAYKIQWFYMVNDVFKAIDKATESTYILQPDGDLWNGNDTVTLKCTFKIDEKHSYSDVFTVRKDNISGYMVSLESDKGAVLPNSICETVIAAHVSFNNKMMDDDEACKKFGYEWIFESADTGKSINVEYEKISANKIKLTRNVDDRSINIMCRITEK